jgi:hypothetical protein
MNDVDRLTLELFTNKSQYKKYLSKIEPENYNEMQGFREKCLEHKCEILKQVEMLLNETDDNDNDNQNHYIQDSFGIFAREVIKEIERKIQKEVDSDNAIYDNEDDEDDDDMLFPPDKMVDNSKPVEKYSFWGKERVIQQNASKDFISHYPTNTSVRRRFVGRRNSILPKDA